MKVQAIAAMAAVFASGGMAEAQPSRGATSASGSSGAGAAGPSGSGMEMMLGSGVGMSGPGSASYDTAPTGGDGSNSTALRSAKGKRSTTTQGAKRANARAVAETGHNSSFGGYGATDENGRGSGRP